MLAHWLLLLRQIGVGVEASTGGSNLLGVIVQRERLGGDPIVRERLGGGISAVAQRLGGDAMIGASLSGSVYATTKLENGT